MRYTNTVNIFPFSPMSECQQLSTRSKNYDIIDCQKFVKSKKWEIKDFSRKTYDQGL